MKAITILQPWATLLLHGKKRYETRSWQTGYRGDLLIHAGRKLNQAMRDLCQDEPFRSVLRDLDYDNAGQLPTGCIIGKVKLIDVLPADAVELTVLEQAFGDFRPGRWVGL